MRAMKLVLPACAAIAMAVALVFPLDRSSDLAAAQRPAGALNCNLTQYKASTVSQRLSAAMC